MVTSIFILGAGLFSIICTILKPAFYWESRKAKQLRNLLGNTATSVFYILIGAALTCMALAFVNFINMFPHY